MTRMVALSDPTTPNISMTNPKARKQQFEPTVSQDDLPRVKANLANPEMVRIMGPFLTEKYQRLVREIENARSQES